jgi:hypothetical protein
MIFISYSSSDRQAAENLSNALTEKGIRFWVDFREIPIGQRFISEIANAIENSTSYVILNPSHSLNSYWVGREFDTALRLRRSEQIRTIVALESTAPRIDLSPALFDSICNSIPDAVNICEKHSRTTVGVRKSNLDRDAIVDFQRKSVDFSDTGNWLGYADCLLAIDNWLFNHLVGLWITGPPGSGKTALIRNWLYAFQRLGYSRIERAAIELIDARACIDLEIPFPQPRAGTERSCIVVIDSAETLNETKLSRAISLAVLMEIRMIIVSRAPCTDSTALHSFRTIELHALSKKDAFLLTTSAGLPMEASKFLYSVTKGKPVKISSLLDTLQTFKKQKKPSRKNKR